jgi:hypothetical protein
MRHLCVLAAVLLAGCFDTVPIRPTELPKMDRMYVSYGPGAVVSPGNIAVGGSTPASVSMTTVETDRSHIDFLAPDGSVTNVPGYADLLLTTRQRTYRFKEIVKVDDEGDRFMIRSSSRTGEVPKADIVSTELRQLNRVQTVFAVTGVTIALTLPLVLFVVTR